MDKPIWLLLVCSLVGCGGGGGSNENDTSQPPAAVDNPPVAVGTPEGVWKGTTSDGRTATAIVLDDGEYWLIFSLVGNSEVVDRVAHGGLTLRGAPGTFQSLPAYYESKMRGRYYAFDGTGAHLMDVDGRYSAKRSLDMTMRIGDPPSKTVTFHGTYDAGYDSRVALPSLAGNYTGYWAQRGIDATSFTFIWTGYQLNATGPDNVGHSASGCTFQGSLIPGDSNVFAADLSFMVRICGGPNGFADGHAYWDASRNTLYVAAVNVNDVWESYLLVATPTT